MASYWALREFRKKTKNTCDPAAIRTADTPYGEPHWGKNWGYWPRIAGIHMNWISSYLFICISKTVLLDGRDFSFKCFYLQKWVLNLCCCFSPFLLAIRHCCHFKESTIWVKLVNYIKYCLPGKLVQYLSFVKESYFKTHHGICLPRPFWITFGYFCVNFTSDLAWQN